MTVKELIAKLQEFDGGLPVAISEDHGDPQPVRQVLRVTVPGDGGWVGAEDVVLIDSWPAGLGYPSEIVRVE